MHELGQTNIQLEDLLRAHCQLQDINSRNRQQTKHSMLAGLQLISQRGRSMEFEHSRIYQHGDDVRGIDWRVSARTGKLHSKVFQQERERRVLLLVEQSPALCFASKGNFMSVQAAYLASYFAWLAYNNHDRIAGLIFAEQPLYQIKPQRSRQTVLRLLYQISQANQQLNYPSSCTRNPLDSALNQCHSMLGSNSLIVLICAQQHLQPKQASKLHALGKKHELILAPISDPMHQQLPHSKQLIFNDTSNYLSLGNAPELHQQWQAQHQQQQQLWQQLAQQTRAVLLPISTDSSVSSQLLALTTARRC